jgi:hypothetical protein
MRELERMVSIKQEILELESCHLYNSSHYFDGDHVSQPSIGRACTL